MRHLFASTFGVGTMLLAGCGGNTVVATGGAGTTSSESTSSSTSTGITSTSSGTGASTTSSSTSSSSTSASSSSSGGACNPTCQFGFDCCEGACINPKNDVDNCGTCGNKCTGTNPYCAKGTCGTPTCATTGCSSSEKCCGTQCCAGDQLCCDVYGPVVLQYPQCTAPVGGTCPGGCLGCVCASPDTPIATPMGDRAISDLAVGDLVYSVEREAVVAVPILRVQRAPVHDHHVVRVTLAGGAVLEISPRHPTADGRTFGDLRRGDTLDRHEVLSAELVPYTHPFTYDILPGSETNTYYAGGALIGTTMPR